MSAVSAGATGDPYQAIRDGVRALCADFPDEYFRRIDRDRGYPEAFVDALTRAGWRALRYSSRRTTLVLIVAP